MGSLVVATGNTARAQEPAPSDKSTDGLVSAVEVEPRKEGPPKPKTIILPSESTLDADARGLCEKETSWDRAKSLCFRVDDRLQPQLVHLPPRLENHLMPPNTSLKVFVVHAKDVTIELKLGGERGFYPPVTDTTVDTKLHGSATSPLRVTDKSFGPRAPDSAVDLSVKATKGKDSGEATLELFVEKTYSGALRLGLGLVVSPDARAVDRDYKAVRVDNSAQYELVASKGGRVEYELVVGYAPFLFDGKKGRAYTSTRLRDRAAGFAPYIGLGVLNVASPTGLELFKSVHLGLELEPQRNVTIAVTAPQSQQSCRLGREGLTVNHLGART